MAEIKSLALDLDGTLLNGEKQISPAPGRPWTRYGGRGCWWCPSPGGPPRGIPQAVLDLPGLVVRGELQRSHHPGPGHGTGLCWKSSSPRPPAWRCWTAAPRCPCREVFRAGVGVPLPGGTMRPCGPGTPAPPCSSTTWTPARCSPARWREFLQADPRPVEELFFLTGSPPREGRPAGPAHRHPGDRLCRPLPQRPGGHRRGHRQGGGPALPPPAPGPGGQPGAGHGGQGERLAPPPGRRHWRGHGQRHRGGEGRGGLRHHLLRRGRGGGGPGEVRAVTEPCPIPGGRELSSCGPQGRGSRPPFVLRGRLCAPAGWGWGPGWYPFQRVARRPPLGRAGGGAQLTRRGVPISPRRITIGSATAEEKAHRKAKQSGRIRESIKTYHQRRPSCELPPS